MPGCSSEELDQSFQRIKFRIHPARHGNSPEAKERFQELQSAYKQLQDLSLRTKYDGFLRESEQQTQQDPNLYKLFGVLSDSSPAELTKAYREIRGRLHPDRNNGSRPAHQRFQELQSAYRTLLDPWQRAQHDRILKGGGMALAHEAETVGDAPARRAPNKRNTESFAGAFADLFRPESEEIMNLAEVTAFYEQVFDLARDLEKSGEEEDLKEAIDWYRLLAQNNHLEAARRLAPLLERIDMREALYRYGQAEKLGETDNLSAMQAAFRQGQIYQTGFFEGEKEIIPKDPKKSEEAFRRAFHRGALPRDIAKQYDLQGDYEKARQWSEKAPAGSQDPVPALGLPEDLLLHKALASPKAGKERSFKTVTSLLETEIDLNAVNTLGQTPLFIAASMLDANAVRVLLKAGADPMIPDSKGVLPVHAAFRSYTTADPSLEKPAWDTFLLLSSQAGLQARAGDTGKTAFEETVFDPKGASAAHFISSAFPLHYLTKEERDRIALKAVADGRDDIIRILTGSVRSQINQIEIIYSRKTAVSEKQSAILSLSEEPVPLSPSAQEALAVTAQGENREPFALQIAALQVLVKRPPMAETAQSLLLDLAFDKLGGKRKNRQDWQIRSLLYEIVSNFRLPAETVQMRLAALAVSNNPLGTSLPKAALQALNNLHYSEDVERELFAGLTDGNLSLLMQNGISESLSMKHPRRRLTAEKRLINGDQGRALSDKRLTEMRLSEASLAERLAPASSGTAVVLVSSASLIGIANALGMPFEGIFYLFHGIIGLGGAAFGAIAGGQIHILLENRLQEKLEERLEIADECRNAFE